MMKKLLFVFNPHSGKSQIRNKLLDIIDVFVKAEYQVTVHPTQRVKDAYELIQSTGGEYDLLVVSGGDGTLNESMNGILKISEEKRPPLAYIPAGTTNDFARTLGISQNMVVAAQNIVFGNLFRCDVGAFQDKNFVYVAAFGAFTDVSYNTPQQNKNLLGHMAYILEGIKSIPSIKSYSMKVEHDYGQIEDNFIFGMVSNTRSVGGFRTNMDYQIDLTDHLFEVVLVKKPANILALQATVTDLLRQDMSSDRLYAFRTSRINFISEREEVTWTLDGEFGGAYKNVSIENLHKAVTLVVPPNVDLLLIEQKGK